MRGIFKSIFVIAILFFLLIPLTGKTKTERKAKTNEIYFDNLVFVKIKGLDSLDSESSKNILDKLNNILKQWKNSEIKFGYIYQNDHFYYSRFNFDLGSKCLNIFEINDGVIEKLVSNYSDDEIAYALQSNQSNSMAARKLLISQYKDNLHKILSFQNSFGNNIVRKDINYYSLCQANAALMMDKYQEHPKKNIYLTNNILLDDGADMPAQTLIRGGVANGLCSTDSGSLIVSYFPLYYKSDLFNNTGAEFESKREDILAAILAHEIGHCYFNFKDNYNNPRSIMCPVHKFQYLEWVNNFQFDAPESYLKANKPRKEKERKNESR